MTTAEASPETDRCDTMRPAHAARSTSVLAVVLALAACSTLPLAPERTPSSAFVDTGGTTLARTVAAGAPVAADADVSGLQLVSRGEEAFGTLYTLIERAERSLDLQYYIVKDDPYARALLRAARAAAERGVRVRLLVDDFYTTGEDERIAWYAAHPNIEVRLFNPFGFGRARFATRLVASVTDLARIDRRMHNKLFVVDNAIAVTGGRNVGSEYYMHAEHTNFLDLDVLAGGPIVHELSDTFDAYWNSPLAVPIERFAPGVGADAATVDQRALLDPKDPVRAATEEARSAGSALADALDRRTLKLTWAPTTLVADRPSKIQRTAPRVGAHGIVAGATIATDVLSIIDTAQRDLVIVSPYFVPGPRGVAALETLVARGVHVRVLTNSLAATDAPIVHIGYARYRRTLIESGVEIYELRPDPGTATAKGVVGSSKASLHAKVLLVDDATLFVGSFNVDPRSALVNTEMGLEIASPALADQVLGILRDRGADSRYRVTIDARGDLSWTTTTDGVEQTFHDEPGADGFVEWSLKLLAPFAPEQLL